MSYNAFKHVYAVTGFLKKHCPTIIYMNCRFFAITEMRIHYGIDMYFRNAESLVFMNPRLRIYRILYLKPGRVLDSYL